jgi:acyl-CoA thioesterase I
MKPLCYLLFLLVVGLLRGADAAPKTILFFGDSLSAGYGLDDPATQAFPGLIQKKITTANLPYLVVNAGSSGETTAGGLRRIDWVLRMPIDVFVLELGGNDGLRGLSPGVAAKNLQAIIDKVRAKNPATKIVIAGMQMPVNMGVAYTGEFASIFETLAKANNATLVPFLLEGVGGEPELNLPDGVHPNVKGHQIVAATLWKTLEPLLKGSPATSAPPNGARVE